MNLRILSTALLLLTACEQPHKQAAAQPAAQAAPTAAPPAVVSARSARMEGLLSSSSCLQHPQAEPWSRDVAAMRESYIDGRLAESVMAAQRAFERCDDIDLVRHMSHCYEALGMKKKADEVRRRYKRQSHQQRRIRVSDTPTRSDGASIPLHDVEAKRPKEP